MSSTSDSLKKAADGAATNEPNQKKAKLSETDSANVVSEKITASDAANNGSNVDKSKIGLEANNGDGGGCSSSSSSSKRVPSKSTVNGGAQQTTADAKQEGEDDDGDDEDGGNLDGIFDPRIAKSLEKVENIQLEICNLNEKASEEILKVEQKFNKLRRPFFEKRLDCLKEIPNFWLTALANHPTIASMIESAEDEDCLHYMTNLDVEEFEDIKSGYTLSLHFAENPYIKNKVIEKQYSAISSDEMVTGVTPIEYKDTPQGRNLKLVVEESIAKFRRSRRSGQAQQSFFGWLVEPLESGQDEIAEILKDQIWPNPLEFFFAPPEDPLTTSSESEESSHPSEMYGSDVNDEDLAHLEDEEVVGEVYCSDEESEDDEEVDEEEVE